MNRKIQFRLLEEKAPVIATYAAPTQPNEQNKRSSNSDEKSEEYIKLRNRT
jgi:hypothetical protein